MPFAYVRAPDEPHAIAAAGEPDAAMIAGGTTVVDLLRLEVIRPRTVVDITGLPLSGIEVDASGVRIGALVSNTEVAYHPAIVERYPALAEALLSGASPQLRNMATVGGNLMQRTRCPYFRDNQTSCNKRAPDSGCAALDGYARSHAVLGTSDKCIATHPSDMCVALIALDAIVHLRSANATRTVPIADFHTLPGDHPEIETVVAQGELVTHVELPARPFAKSSRYVKVRDRASFAFALASAAVALDIAAGTIREARIALGGIATKPWRAREAELMLAGQPVALDGFRRAAIVALRGARPRADNRFKIELARRTVVRALARAGGLA